MSEVLATNECCATCGHGSVRPTGFIRCAKQREYEMFSPKSACSIGQWTPITEVTAARRAAQEGIDRAVAAAERHSIGWGEVAFLFIKLYATLNKRKKFTGHDVIAASVAHKIIQPPNAKAWGGPLQRAARAGLIVKVGTTEDPRRHGNPIPLWSTPE